MKLMVFDGNSIVNRAFYGIRPLTTRDGLHTNAIYGFLTTLLRLIEEEKPDAVSVTFDRREPTFRHLSYEGYKAKRKGMPEELCQQMPVLKEVLDAMNIPRYELAGFEADDLIGTISRKCEAEQWECIIVTGDRDSLQLITDHTKVKLVSTKMGKTITKDMTPETFFEEYGFSPIHLVDLKALMGDNSDSIPGVTGIGEKSAMALVQQYETVEKIYSLLPDIDAKPGVIKKLQEGQEQAQLSYRLAEIHTDAPLAFSPSENLRKPPQDTLYDIFLRLEFVKLMEKLKLKPPAVPKAVKPCLYDKDAFVCWQHITTEEALGKQLSAIESVSDATVYALEELAGLAVCWDKQGFVVLRQHVSEESYRTLLETVFSPKLNKSSHQVKHLAGLLIAEQLPLSGFRMDTALSAYLLDATAGSFALKDLAGSYLGVTLPEEDAFLSEDAFAPLSDHATALKAFTAYTEAIHRLVPILKEKLQALRMWELLEEIELPLSFTLAKMEQQGFLVDRTALAAYGERLTTAIDTLEQQIYSHAGKFNINSPKQLGQILFDELGLPPIKKTKTGYSTNAEVLEKLRFRHPIVDEVLEYRQYTKLRSTYVDGLLKVIDKDGRIRTSFQMTVTATGRLSSTEPNLQNIPTRTELGSEIRRMFVAKEGCVLVDADYSQIELRLLAHISGDQTMQEAFNTGEDIHTITAAKVFGVPVDQVTGSMRRAAKAVNFGIVYGISPFSLSQDIGVTVSEAKDYMESYFHKYPGVRSYMEQIVEQARKDGYVETLYHRRRNLPEIKSSNFNMRSFGERVALNMPIQGTAADLMKLAMLAVDKRLNKEGLKAALLMQVHDELIVECPAEEAETVRTLLIEEMEQVAKLNVPLTVDAHIGKNWLEAKG